MLDDEQKFDLRTQASYCITAMTWDPLSRSSDRWYRDVNQACEDGSLWVRELGMTDFADYMLQVAIEFGRGDWEQTVRSYSDKVLEELNNLLSQYDAGTADDEVDLTPCVLEYPDPCQLYNLSDSDFTLDQTEWDDIVVPGLREELTAAGFEIITSDKLLNMADIACGKGRDGYSRQRIWQDAWDAHRDLEYYDVVASVDIIADVICRDIWVDVERTNDLDG